MYDMKPMAESLASQGRYGDSMLVHMNPVEVAGLRAAAQRMGGDLTTNPRTGQPEAFLPFLLGMGLQGLGMSALGAGIATGLGTAAITGDLGKGALAGLGAYGGAGMGEGLSAAGGAEAASSTMPTTGLNTGLSTTPPPTSLDVSLTGGAGTGLSTSAPTTGLQVGMPELPSSTEMFNTQVPIETVNNLGLSQPMDTTFTSVAKTGPIVTPDVTGFGTTTATGSPLTGLRNVLSTGETGTAAREAFMQGVGGEKGLLGYTAAGIAPYAFEQPGVAGYEGQRSLIRPFDYDPMTREFTERTPYTAPGPEYMARGGMVQRMAQGGLTGYKEGNILRGQGDGMSDEIEASIGGEQDVLLSDGEYVVPADAVAMLGNGSTDAGANRLDEMIARLRMKKYGRDKQPPEMKAESVMPV